MKLKIQLRFEGESHTLKEWAAIRGVSESNLLKRYRVNKAASHVLEYPARNPKTARKDPWSTGSELDYIRGLGTFCTSGGLIMRTKRKQLLKKYIEVFTEREFTENINSLSVLRFAKMQLKAC